MTLVALIINTVDGRQYLTEPTATPDVPRGQGTIAAYEIRDNQPGQRRWRVSSNCIVACLAITEDEYNSVLAGTHPLFS